MRISWKHQKHIKKQIPLLDFLINWISARSVLQMLSIKDECNFLLSIFLIIILCNSPANSFLDIISFLTVPAEFFCQNICKPLKKVYVDIHHIFDL